MDKMGVTPIKVFKKALNATNLAQILINRLLNLSTTPLKPCAMDSSLEQSYFEERIKYMWPELMKMEERVNELSKITGLPIKFIS